METIINIKFDITDVNDKVIFDVVQNFNKHVKNINFLLSELKRFQIIETLKIREDDPEFLIELMETLENEVNLYRESAEYN